MQYLVIADGLKRTLAQSRVIEAWVDATGVELYDDRKYLAALTPFAPAYNVVLKETRKQTWLPEREAYLYWPDGFWGPISCQDTWENSQGVVITNQPLQPKKPEPPVCWECGSRTIFQRVPKASPAGYDYRIHCTNCCAQGKWYSTQQKAKDTWEGRK